MPARRHKPQHQLSAFVLDLRFIENQCGDWLRGVPVTLSDIDDFARPARRLLTALDAERARLLSKRERDPR